MGTLLAEACARAEEESNRLPCLWRVGAPCWAWDGCGIVNVGRRGGGGGGTVAGSGSRLALGHYRGAIAAGGAHEDLHVRAAPMLHALPARPLRGRRPGYKTNALGRLRGSGCYSTVVRFTCPAITVVTHREIVRKC